jgi:hypothetical protein
MTSKRDYYIRFSIITLSMLLCNSCNKSIKGDSIEDALTKMVQKFPQLPKSKWRQSDIYKPVRTVIIEPDKIQVKLCTTNDSFPNCNEIIVITNSVGKSRAIPFPANFYRSYWNFQLDELSGGNSEFHTTFNNEFRNTMDSLGLNDTLGTSYGVLNEMFLSLLHFEMVRLSDSDEIRTCYGFNEGDIFSENEDSSRIRLNKTWDTISKIICPSPSFNDYTRVFLDRENHRIYEIDFKRKAYKYWGDFEIKTYRLGSVAPPPIMM